MQINTNIAAVNAYRNLSQTENEMDQSLERLSSGLRINRAADDAAGLSISEKMRGQINGLDQSSSNAQDSISLIQTAEGALDESHSILQRMRELSAQAANDTLTASDRVEIQNEIDQLSEELDRIGDTTEFNTKNLLDGSASALTSTSDAETEVHMRGSAENTGNFDINIKEADIGNNQVQKTDIMSAAHENMEEYNYLELGDEDGDNTISIGSLNGSYEVEIVYGDANAGAGFEGTPDIAADKNARTIRINHNPDLKEMIFWLRARDQASQAPNIPPGADAPFEDITVKINGELADLPDPDEVYVEGETPSPGDLFTIDEAVRGSLNYEKIQTDTQLVDYVYLEAAALYDDVTIEIEEVSEVVEGGVDYYEGDPFEGEALGITVDNNRINVQYARDETRAPDEQAPSMQDLTELLDNADKVREIVDIRGAGAGAYTNLYDETINLKGAGISEAVPENAKLSQIDRFYDASGNFMLDEPADIELVQGDGNRTTVTLYQEDTIADVVDKLNEAIHEGLNQKRLGDSFPDAYVQYVNPGEASDDELFTTEGTLVIQSAVAGVDGEISFLGDEDILNAFSIETIQESSETQYTIDVENAHTGEKVASDVEVTGNMLRGVIDENVDVEFYHSAGINKGEDAEAQELPGEEVEGEEIYEVIDTHFDSEEYDDAQQQVHIADNSMVFHIGANPQQNVDASIGDMRANALGVDNLIVTDQEAANRAIEQIDQAIERVSSERALTGAIQNRLEHTIDNLKVAKENLSAAESRIRDVDMAEEMVAFTRHQIMIQAGSSMLAEANMKPENVLALLS